MKLDSIINKLHDELKLKPQEHWDNSGLQIGNINSDIKKIMLTLDLDIEALKYAVNNNINLIITHHPFLFGSINTIDYNTYDGSIIKSIIVNNINLYSLHTTLDMAEFGVNYELAQKLCIHDYDILHPINVDRSGYGGIADIESINIMKFAEFVKISLECKSVKLFCNDKTKNIRRVAFCGGSGSDFIKDAINKGADVYITGDIKYHQAQEALKNNLILIDAGHYYTECHSLNNMKFILDKIYDLEIYQFEKNTVEEIIL